MMGLNCLSQHKIPNNIIIQERLTELYFGLSNFELFFWTTLYTFCIWHCEILPYLLLLWIFIKNLTYRRNPIVWFSIFYQVLVYNLMHLNNYMNSIGCTNKVKNSLDFTRNNISFREQQHTILREWKTNRILILCVNNKTPRTCVEQDWTLMNNPVCTP